VFGSCSVSVGYYKGVNKLIKQRPIPDMLEVCGEENNISLGKN